MWGDRPGPVCNNTPLCTIHYTPSHTHTRHSLDMFRATHCINVITVMGFTEAEEDGELDPGERCIVRGPMVFAAYNSLHWIMKWPDLPETRCLYTCHCKKSLMPCGECGPSADVGRECEPCHVHEAKPLSCRRCQREAGCKSS